ncbi:MAG: flagellar M-ring protein FliF [Synergistaceae bacterium]|jgi:flagellar M-ring protein FliF|nr:flagellar M-ring protein FliF [Synergistaceae bacterium]
MKGKLAELGERFRSFWETLHRWQQISMAAAVVAVLGGILLMTFAVGRQAYEPIFSGLEARDQEAVISHLKAESIPYRTDSAANAILVPTQNVYEARIALAAKGIPSGGVVGFEIMDKLPMGADDFQKKVAYYRSLEGELSRTIREMNAVASAKVSIVVPESRLFLEQQQPSTAAILLKLRSGSQFGQDQAKAVVHLISHSVEGLLPENVTLVDADGVINFEDILDDSLTVQNGNKLVLRQRQFERDYEEEFERKIEDSLKKIYGPGKVKAAVRVELDFNKRQMSIRLVSPLPEKLHGTLQSTQVRDENYSGPAGVYGGPPGTTTNIPGYPANTGQTNVPSEYSLSETVNNYDNSTQESQEIETQGQIKRITATVFIDGQLDQRQQDDMRNAVATAIGTDDSRGDRLTVMATAFDTTMADALAARVAQERRNRMILGASSFVVFLMGVMAALALWVRRRRQQSALQRGRASDVDETPSLRELLENPDLMTAQGELSVLEEQLRNYAMNNPEELANLIKNWVVDDV